MDPKPGAPREQELAGWGLHPRARGVELRSEDLERITRIVIGADDRVADLRGINFPRNLRVLTLEQSRVRDLAPIEALVQLRTLEIRSPTGALPSGRCT